MSAEGTLMEPTVERSPAADVRLVSVIVPAVERADNLLARYRCFAEELEQTQTNERLERALRELPDHQRVPLVLFHFEELTYQEISALMRISLAKVKTDIHRGREALRKLITE